MFQIHGTRENSFDKIEINSDNKITISDNFNFYNTPVSPK